MQLQPLSCLGKPEQLRCTCKCKSYPQVFSWLLWYSVPPLQIINQEYRQNTVNYKVSYQNTPVGQTYFSSRELTFGMRRLTEIKINRNCQPLKLNRRKFEKNINHLVIFICVCKYLNTYMCLYVYSGKSFTILSNSVCKHVLSFCFRGPLRDELWEFTEA